MGFHGRADTFGLHQLPQVNRMCEIIGTAVQFVDVLQDTLVQFLRTAPVLNKKEHEKAWLLHVAANLSKNRIKYNAIRHTDELMEELVAENRDDLSFVWEAVKDLPDKYREVVHLFYHEGYQTAQIAQILGMKETTVRSNLSRGREKLKAVLKEAYDFG